MQCAASDMHRATCTNVRTTQHTRMRTPGCKAAPHVKHSVQRAPYPVSIHSNNFQHACMPGSCVWHAHCSMVAHASAQPRTAIPILVPNNVGRLCGAAGAFEPCLDCKVAPVNRLVDGRRLALCAHARSGVPRVRHSKTLSREARSKRELKPIRPTAVALPWSGSQSIWRRSVRYPEYTPFTHCLPCVYLPYTHARTHSHTHRRRANTDARTRVMANSACGFSTRPPARGLAVRR